MHVVCIEVYRDIMIYSYMHIMVSTTVCHLSSSRTASRNFPSKSPSSSGCSGVFTCPTRKLVKSKDSRAEAWTKKREPNQHINQLESCNHDMFQTNKKIKTLTNLHQCEPKMVCWLEMSTQSNTCGALCSTIEFLTRL